jgi:hypothetical protein
VRSDQILAFQCFRRGDAIGSARLGLEAPSNARAAVALRLMQVHSRSALPRLRLQGTGRRPARSARPRSANRWAAWPSGRYSGVRTSNRTVFCPPNGAGNSLQSAMDLVYRAWGSPQNALRFDRKGGFDVVQKSSGIASLAATALSSFKAFLASPCVAARTLESGTTDRAARGTSMHQADQEDAGDPERWGFGGPKGTLPCGNALNFKHGPQARLHRDAMAAS